MNEIPKSRQVLTKKNVKLFIKKLLLTLIVLSPVLIFLGSTYIYQILIPSEKAPFIQWSGHDPRTEVIVTWETLEKEQSAVWYGTDKDDLSEKLTNDNKVKIHRIIIDDLEPDTKYYYRVGVDGSDKEYRCSIQSFSTAPNDTNTDFSFGLYSDSQQFFGIGWHAQICQALANYDDLSFVAIPGDLCQNWDYKPDWNQFFYEAATYLKDTPIVPCMGNHDGYYPEDDPDANKHYYETYFGTTNKSNDPHTFYYSFNWSNTQFIIGEIADTGDENPDDPININHDNWLKKTLANGQDKDFRILMFHRQVFSAEEDNDVLIDRIVPIVEKYNVSLVLYGHHHHYERFLYHEQTYICLGGGGGQQFGSNYFRPTKYTESFIMGPSFTKISVDSNEINIKTYTPEGNLIDSCTLKLKNSIAELK